MPQSETPQETHWDSYWKDNSNRDYWLEPDPAVAESVKGFDKTAVRDALDLGCGIGRHTRLLVESGFRVTAVDNSEAALAALRDHIGKQANINLLKGDYSQDLFAPDSFDIVLAWNVLYHGGREQFKNAAGLVHKWLRPGGLFFFTCPTRRDAKYGSGEEVSPNAYRSLNSVHPGDVHYFADDADLADFLSGFSIISTNTKEHVWDNHGARQFSSYWHVLARKSPRTK